MVQFNLLPDVKLEFIRARRIKRLVTLISVVAAGVALAAMLLVMATVYGVQKKSLHDLNSDISKYSGQLKSTPNLDKILTVQNQLNTLTDLHNQKVVGSRLFGYIAQVTPSQASLNKLTVDFAAHTITLGGTAPSLDVVGTYTDTLKATTYTTSDSTTSAKAFNSVVLASFGRDVKGATFTITANFDPPIFDSSSTPKLTVPSGSSSDVAKLFGGTN